MTEMVGKDGRDTVFVTFPKVFDVASMFSTLERTGIGTSAPDPCFKASRFSLACRGLDKAPKGGANTSYLMFFLWR